MLGLKAAVENHIRKHQKKPAVAIVSCSTLWPRMNVCSAAPKVEWAHAVSTRFRQQGVCQGRRLNLCGHFHRDARLLGARCCANCPSLRQQSCGIVARIAFWKSSVQMRRPLLSGAVRRAGCRYAHNCCRLRLRWAAIADRVRSRAALVVAAQSVFQPV